MKAIFCLSKGVVKPRTIKLFCFAVLLTTLGLLQGQETQDKWYGMVNINEGYRINENTEFYTPGLSYELYFRLTNSFGLQSKTGFLYWKDADMDSYFTMIGSRPQRFKFLIWMDLPGKYSLSFKL